MIRPGFNAGLHQVSLLYRLGPLVRYLTMRYEAKHQYFKSLATHGEFHQYNLFTCHETAVKPVLCAKF